MMRRLSALSSTTAIRVLCISKRSPQPVRRTSKLEETNCTLEAILAQIGFSLSSEEHGALDLVRYAQRAEEAGFSFALISDHYHPWISKQGESPFVWSVIGAIAACTQ